MLNRAKFTGILVAAAVAVTSIPLAPLAMAAPLMPLPAMSTATDAPMANLVEVKKKKRKHRIKKSKHRVKKSKRKLRKHRSSRRYYDPGPFIGGAILGAIIANQAPAYVYRRAYPNAHVHYCYARYRSYRAWDNSFQSYHGPRRACRSPYWP